MAEVVVWHEYRTREQPLRGNPIPALIKETLCGGKWYARGKAPCELQDADDATALDLHACEVDEADIAAMRELLALPPRATVCRFKGRASWDDKVSDSEEFCVCGHKHGTAGKAPGEKYGVCRQLGAGCRCYTWAKPAQYEVQP